MEFRKVGKRDYEVYDNDGDLMGYLYKERQKGSGTSRKYVGFVPAYSAWVWQPLSDDLPHRTFHNGETFYWVKDWLRLLFDPKEENDEAN